MQDAAAPASSKLYVQYTEIIIPAEYDKECPLDPKYLKQMQAFPSLSISVTDTQTHPLIACGSHYLCSAWRKRCVVLSLLHSTKTLRNLVPQAVPTSFRLLVRKQGGKQQQPQKNHVNFKLH